MGPLIDGITNDLMVIYEMGPAPAAIEFVLINWMLGKVGWNSGADSSCVGCTASLRPNAAENNGFASCS